MKPSFAFAWCLKETTAYIDAGGEREHLVQQTRLGELMSCTDRLNGIKPRQLLIGDLTRTATVGGF